MNGPANRLRRFHCWWDGFAATWLSLGMWASRMRILLRPGGPHYDWPGVVESGHLLDPDSRHFEVIDGKEHEWMTCSRCGTIDYIGWKEYRAT